MLVKLDRALLISFFLLAVDVEDVASSLWAISLYFWRSLSVNSLHLHPETLFFSDRVSRRLPSTNKILIINECDICLTKSLTCWLKELPMPAIVTWQSPHFPRRIWTSTRHNVPRSLNGVINSSLASKKNSRHKHIQDSMPYFVLHKINGGMILRRQRNITNTKLLYKKRCVYRQDQTSFMCTQ